MEVLPATVSIDQKPAEHQKQGLTLICVFSAGILLFDLLAFPGFRLINRSFPWATDQLLKTTIAGAIVGQTMCLIVVAGWLARHWLYGLCVASLLGMLALNLLLWGSTWIGWFLVEDGLAIVPVIPLCLFVAAIPFYVLRHFSGWQLTFNSQLPLQRNNGIGELFIVTAVVGALLFLARTSAVMAEIRENLFWKNLGTSVLSFGLFSLTVVLPAAIIAWRIKHGTNSVLAHFAYVVLAIALWSTLGVRFLGVASVTTVDGMVAVTGSVILPTCLFFTGMWVLRAGGFTLVAFVKQPSVNAHATNASLPVAIANPWNGEEAEQSPPSDTPKQLGPRRLAYGLLVVSMMGSLGVQQVDRWRRNTELRHNQLGAELANSGGRIEVSNRRVVSLKLGPQADDQTLKQYLYLKDIASLDLSGTKITDAAFESISGFRHLQNLDLSYTNITAQGMQKFPVQSNAYYKLNIAGTKISADDLIAFLTTNWKVRIRALDLSYMSWNLDELKRVAPYFRAEMSLRGFNMNDEQLIELMAIAEEGGGFQLFDVDLSDNQLSGRFLKDWAPQHRLVLKNNPLNDAEFGGALASRPFSLKDLCLSGTQLTNASLSVIDSRMSLNRLSLGEGMFTEQGLLSVKLNGVDHMRLNARSFTGESLEMRTVSMQLLDLSGSGVNDNSLKRLSQLRVSSLNLADTEITDASLPTLAGFLFQQEVDLSHTKITAQGLLRGDLVNYQRVIVAPGQFSQEAVKQLRKIIKIDIGGKISY